MEVANGQVRTAMKPRNRAIFCSYQGSTGVYVIELQPYYRRSGRMRSSPVSPEPNVTRVDIFSLNLLFKKVSNHIRILIREFRVKVIILLQRQCSKNPTLSWPPRSPNLSMCDFFLWSAEN